jgi:uncharacterized protein (DUF983 family)
MRAVTTEAGRRSWRFLLRALRLRCPECGASPIFRPITQTRSWHHWATPLSGCPRCDYAYEREPGYFLPAIWVVHVFTVFGFGLVLGLSLDVWLHVPLGLLVVTVCVPMLLFALAFVRHAKAIYLAADHLIDPQRRSPQTHSTKPGNPQWTGKSSPRS